MKKLSQLQEELIASVEHHAGVVSSLARRIGNQAYNFEKRTDKDLLLAMDTRIARLKELNTQLYTTIANDGEAAEEILDVKPARALSAPRLR